MAAVGDPRQNSYAERVIRTIKEEEIDLAAYRDFTDALAPIGQFIDGVYRTKRIHSALGYLTPAEFETAWWQEHTKPEARHEDCHNICPAFRDHYTYRRGAKTSSGSPQNQTLSN